MAKKYISEHGQIFYDIGGINFDEWKYRCFECKHLNEDYSTCPAFPKGIPEKIITGKFIHKKIIPKQKGETTFEALPTKLIKKRFQEMYIDEVLNQLQLEIDAVNSELYDSDNKNTKLIFYKAGLTKALNIIMKVFKFKVVK